MIQCHNSEEWNVQKHHYENLKSYTAASQWCRNPIVPSTNLFKVYAYGAVHLHVFHIILRACVVSHPSCHFSVCKILFTDTNTDRMPVQITSTNHRHKTWGQNSVHAYVCTCAPVFTEEWNVLCTAYSDMKYFRNMLTQTSE
jgi:hypothetical protein